MPSSFLSAVPAGVRAPRAVTRGGALVLAVLLLAVSVVVTTATSASAVGFARGDVAREWAPLHMADRLRLTDAEAQAIAERFDLVAAVPVSIRNHSDAMRATKPGLKVLAYSNATFASPAESRAYGDDEFARDLTGAKIWSTNFFNHLMDVSDPTWRGRVPNLCRAASNRANGDGCLADMFTLGVFSRGYLTSLPRNPATGALWNQADYRTELVSLAEETVERADDVIVAGNAISNAYRYVRNPVSSAPIARALTLPQMEDFLRGAGDAVDHFPGEADWRDNVAVLADLEAADRGVLATTKLWTEATAAERDQWHRYAMATFLMGADGRSLFAFTTSRDKAGATGFTHTTRLPDGLGAALEPMRAVGGIYRRELEGGTTLVNPTDVTRTLALGSRYRDLDGNEVTEVTLRPDEGEVLVRLGPPPAPPVDPEPPVEPEPEPEPTIDPEPDATAPIGADLDPFTPDWEVPGLASRRVTGATMVGANVLPGPGPSWGTASARIEVRAWEDVICLRDQHNQRTGRPEEVLVRRGAPDEVGEDVVVFRGPIPDQCLEVDSEHRQLLREIRDHPYRFHLQITNLAFPDGALRGRLVA